MPGRLLNRVYPIQWAVRMQRPGLQGLGSERCTMPSYIDWDPEACPETAPDLFLAYYPWYWPTILPKPADLETDKYKDMRQAKCNSEVISKLLLCSCQCFFFSCLVLPCRNNARLFRLFISVIFFLRLLFFFRFVCNGCFFICFAVHGSCSSK